VPQTGRQTTTVTATVGPVLNRGDKNRQKVPRIDPAYDLPLQRTVFNYPHSRRVIMKRHFASRAGKIKYGLFAWLIGLPLPIVLILLFYRGCDF
jgi:hypothetical protein